METWLPIWTNSLIDHHQTFIHIQTGVLQTRWVVSCLRTQQQTSVSGLPTQPNVPLLHQNIQPVPGLKTKPFLFIHARHAVLLKKRCFLECCLNFLPSFHKYFPFWMHMCNQNGGKYELESLSLCGICCAVLSPPLPIIILQPVICLHSPSSSLHKLHKCVRVCHSMCLNVGVWLACLGYCPTASHSQLPLCTPSARRSRSLLFASY